MGRDRVESYQDLEVWKRGMQLVCLVYEATSRFPVSEQYNLSDQLRRAAVSVPSNIAEGWGRSTAKHYTHYLRQARSALFEIETQILISVRLGYLTSDEGTAILEKTDIESRMLMGLIKSINR
jgi:four helix bundle protein